MAVAIVMPKLGLTMQTGTVTQWNVSEGQRVAAGSAVAEITTEKITYVLEAPAEGVLLKVVVPVDGEAPIGAAIGIFGQPGEDIASLLDGAMGVHADGVAPPVLEAPPAPGPAPTAEDRQPIASAASGARVPASPAAKKRAAEIGIDLARVSGTGPGGRVTLDDVNNAADREVASPLGAGSAVSASEAPASGVSSRAVGVPAASNRALSVPSSTSRTAPPVMTHHVRAGAHSLTELLATFNAHQDGRGDISVTAAMVKAVAATLRERPRTIAAVDGEAVREGSGIAVGVAVAVADCVTVGVVRDAAAKTLGEVSREIAALGLGAQENAPPNETLGDMLFTVADMSGYGSVDWSTPSIHCGGAAILGVGRIVDDVVAVDGSPAVRPTVGLSLTFDPQVIDQASAADFLAVLLDLVAHPVRMLV